MLKHWHKIRKIHFDPVAGAPFWLNRTRSLNIDVFEEVKTIADFSKLGPLTLEVLRETPPMDFVPMSQRGIPKIPVESGGSSGVPILTFFNKSEFKEAFVTPFLNIVAKGLFPKRGSWLYLGPTGPHAIGKAACICSEELTQEQPYTIDFDPRWAKKLPSDSLAARRYLDHLCEQAIRVWKRANITVLFVTPPVLDHLCDTIPQKKRMKIKGIQLGGMSATPSQWKKWSDSFPHAKFLIGYGNSLIGVMYRQEEYGGYVLPSSPRMLVDTEKTTNRVVIHRLDPSVLYLNLLERDQAVKKTVKNIDIVCDVKPLVTMNNVRKGLY